MPGGRYNSAFEASKAGIGLMLQSDMIKDAMEHRANIVKDIAVILSPTDSGTYRSSFRVSTGLTNQGGGLRAYGRVHNDARHAAAVEYGWRHTPKQRILGKALNITFQLG